MVVPRRRIAVLHGEAVRVDPQWREALGCIGIAPAGDWPRLESKELMSASSTTRCYRLALTSGETVFFKREVFPRRRWLQYWLRPARTGVEVFAYESLKMLGIPTLTTLAYGERRKLGMLTAAFVVTQEVPDTIDMQRFALDEWVQMDESERRAAYQQIVRCLLDQLRRAHRARFFHHDLKWRNVLIRRTADGYSTVWIDAPRASFRRLRHRRGVIVDLSGLARLAVSLTSRYDRMRFLCQYLGTGRKPGEASRLYRAIASHLQRRPPRPLTGAAALKTSESM